MTLHDLVAELTGYLNLTPEQQFRVTAKVKRLVHHEKTDLCYRLHLYTRGPGIYEKDPNDPEKSVRVGEAPPDDPFISNILKEKAETHEYWASLSDEEIVTWDVGSHEFVQERPPCDTCKTNLTGKGISQAHVYENGKHSYFCRPCAEKSGLWEKLTRDE